MPPSPFVWYDLMTTDTAAAQDFYGKVVGWTYSDSGLTDRSYTMLSMGSTMVGGMMPIAAQAHGSGPAWMGYVGVENVDDSAEQVKAAGGAIHRGPEDIPHVGRFAVVADPQGAVFVLFQSNTMPPPDAGTPRPGHVGWHELMASDLHPAYDFYASHYGWTDSGTVDMGPFGPYKMFAIAGVPKGGMMKKPADAPMPYWAFYFVVDGIAAAAKRVTDNGGKLLSEPRTVPGGSWIVPCLDPQGAFFNLTSAKA